MALLPESNSCGKASDAGTDDEDVKRLVFDGHGKGALNSSEISIKLLCGIFGARFIASALPSGFLNEISPIISEPPNER